MPSWANPNGPSCRYDTPEQVQWLNAIYDLHDQYANPFLPMRKLVGKERHGTRVRKRYDQAKTPVMRLIDSGILTTEQAERLLSLRSSLDPLALHTQLERALATPAPAPASLQPEPV